MRQKVILAGGTALAVALTLSACSGGGGQGEADAAPPRTGGAPTGGVDAGGGGTQREPITLQFAGDTHFEDVLAGKLAADPAHAMGPIAATLRSSDFTMVNLETAITTAGTPAPGKEFHFRAPASAFTALKAAGVDAVTMANNHGMDYGRDGLKDSLAAIRRSGFPTVGIGKDASQAYSAYRTTVKGNRLAIVGATQVLDDNLVQEWTATDAQGGLASAKIIPRMLQAVRDARKDSDLVIVYLHWGQEMQTCPLARQEELAKQLIGAGADIIVGSHAHVLLGGGYLQGKYVDYGLGNFHFSSARGKTAESGVLKLVWTPSGQSGSVTKATWLPAVVSGGLPLRLSGTSATTAAKNWAALRGCTGLTAHA